MWVVIVVIVIIAIIIVIIIIVIIVAIIIFIIVVFNIIIIIIIVIIIVVIIIIVIVIIIAIIILVLIRRLENVFEVLTWKQPRCPQLYVYSSSDRVIPANSVESFVEEQRKAGHQVRAHNFVSSPHVDHFRTHPSLYTSHLSSFLDDYVLTCAQKQSIP